MTMTADFFGADLVHYHHGRKLGGMQADTVLEKELRVLTSIPTGNRKWSGTLSMA